ncbi:MAG: GNAT family N-acetyltransferase [Halobacteriovoraceae bacterium]|nr:GNAT family N-acetyltransferase [Halobacteriovoraceae bacterium]
MKINDIIKEEYYIWNSVYQSKIFQDRFVAFNDSAYPDHHYWNTCFDSKFDFEVPNLKILNEINNHYNEINIKGFIVTIDKKYKNLKLGTDKYFYYKNSTDKNNIKNNKMISIESYISVEDFSKCVGIIFNFDGDFTSYFSNKMKILSHSARSKFYAIKYNGKLVGCFSLFSMNNTYDFLMNFGILPEYRGNDIGYETMKTISLLTDLPILTHTDSSKMMNSILPKSGFQYAGEAYFIPISNLI